MRFNLLYSDCFLGEKFIYNLIYFLVLIHSLLPLLPAKFLFFLLREIPQLILINELVLILYQSQVLLLFNLIELKIVPIL
jgi:hypothetical protein